MLQSWWIACCEFIFSCNHTVMSKENHRERQEHTTIRRCEDKAQLCTHVINYKDWPWSYTKPLRLIELAELSQSRLRLSLAPHLCNHWNACNIYLHGYWELLHTYSFSSLNGIECWSSNKVIEIPEPAINRKNRKPNPKNRARNKQTEEQFARRHIYQSPSSTWW